MKYAIKKINGVRYAQIAKRQGVRPQTIHQRKNQGWSDDEILRGYRVTRNPNKIDKNAYRPKFGGVYHNARELVRALLFEVTKSILCKEFQWSDKEDVQHAIYTCSVFNNLVDGDLTCRLKTE